MSCDSPVVILWGQKDIARALGLADPRAVSRLARDGAPVRIRRAGKGRRYCATLSALVRWLESRT